MLETFLKELKALCDKYRAEICGCGCCGSPNIIFYHDDGKTSGHEELSVSCNKDTISVDGKKYPSS